MGQTYKLIELVGLSNNSFSDAAQDAVTEASKTVRDIAWFEVTEQRGRVVDGAVKEYQVKIKVAFKLAR